MQCLQERHTEALIYWFSPAPATHCSVLLFPGTMSDCLVIVAATHIPDSNTDEAETWPRKSRPTAWSPSNGNVTEINMIFLSGQEENQHVMDVPAPQTNTLWYDSSLQGIQTSCITDLWNRFLVIWSELHVCSSSWFQGVRDTAGSVAECRFPAEQSHRAR